MQHEFEAFSGGLSDFDVHGHLLAASGFSSLSGMPSDRFLMLYDLRMTRNSIPVQMEVDPLFLRFVPNYRSRLAVISQTGTKCRWFKTSLVGIFVGFDFIFLLRLANKYATYSFILTRIAALL